MSLRLKRFFIITFSFFLFLWGVSAFSLRSNEKVDQINAEIQELEAMKKGYEAKALRHESQAEYLQFDQQAVLETRRHLRLAEENRNKAKLIQERIDRLNQKKQNL